MKYLFVEYPPCSTCRKAKKFLDDHRIAHVDRHIVENTPNAAELTAWIERSRLPLKKFFNTSGLLYKSLHLKERLPELSEAEAIRLLSSNGMLIKRPLLIGDDLVLVGFDAEKYAELTAGGRD
ncbi:arsenate reductase family protein [Victivallis sp. Marseille-Q1083]|uniref:arsenate reductase family protein n=1 Tax=Victivallis sp. Marseille-Q1083 TaxID=2717288 RepID=UPI00158B1788|nr:arsenate reductase family protein [Victivallis sp. Marseille-Q1083]